MTTRLFASSASLTLLLILAACTTAPTRIPPPSATKRATATMPTPAPPAPPKPLSSGLAVIETGTFSCLTGASLEIQLEGGGQAYLVKTPAMRAPMRMVPVASISGALRLEDQTAGGVFLQLANKSMFFNQREGKRIADDCQSARQKAYAEEMVRNPPKNGL